MVRENADGSVQASDAAATRLRGQTDGGLLQVLARLLGEPADEDALADLIRGARDGQQGRLRSAAGAELLVGPGEAPGFVVAALRPAETLATDANASAESGPAPTLSAQIDQAVLNEQLAGVSHELSNALSAIAGWARLARQGKRVDEALELIEKSADNAWSTARHMLGAMANPGEQMEQTIDLAAFARDVTRLLGPKAMQNGVHVRCHAQAEAPVRASRGPLWTVVWNLAANAIEAMPDGGQVTIEVSAEAGHAHLQVIDDGPGMSEHLQARAFDPHFTTKASGSGIGLSMVRRTVEQLGGELRLESHEGQGSRFDVSLPLAPSTAQPSGRPSGKRASGIYRSEPPQGRVLLVEDDAALREFVATTMELRGMSVVAVGSGAEARAQAGHFQVAVVDLLLPDCRGDQLIGELRNEHRLGAALLLSGTELPERVSPNGRPDAVLRKPFDVDHLFERLREITQAPASRTPLTAP